MIDPSIPIQPQMRPACRIIACIWDAETALKFKVISLPSDVRMRTQTPVRRARAVREKTSTATTASAIVGKFGRLSTNISYQAVTSFSSKGVSLILKPISCNDNNDGAAGCSVCKASVRMLFSSVPAPAAF